MVKHNCAICKSEVTNTRNIFAECLLHYLDLSRNDLKSGKVNIQDTKFQSSYDDCCYSVYGLSCQGNNGPQFDPQAYSRLQVPYVMPQQYNFSTDSYVTTDSQAPLQYFDQNGYYSDYSNTAYYSCESRKDVNERRSKFNFASQSSTVSLGGESSKRYVIIFALNILNIILRIPC